MINFKDIIENEDLADVLSYLLPYKPMPVIDNLFTRYKFEVVENALIYPTYKKLLDSGILTEDDEGHVRKGPNWKEPAFVTQKKYGIE